MTPRSTSRRQRGPDTRAAIRCHYAADPALRPHCTVTAEITLGGVALCGSCGRARSSLGKGTIPEPVPPGPVIDVLDWIADADAAVRRARRHLDAAVTRARSRGTSWTQIAGRLGITRQAAQQRFGRDPITTGTGTRPAAITASQERTPS